MPEFGRYVVTSTGPPRVHIYWFEEEEEDGTTIRIGSLHDPGAVCSPARWLDRSGRLLASGSEVGPHGVWVLGLNDGDRPSLEEAIALLPNYEEQLSDVRVWAARLRRMGGAFHPGHRPPIKPA